MTSGSDNRSNSAMPAPLPSNTGLALKDSSPPVQAVLNWLISGAGERDIIEALVANFPAVDSVAVLSAVAAKLEAEGRPNTDALRGWALLAYRDLYRRMVDIGDFAGALKAVKEMVRAVK